MLGLPEWPGFRRADKRMKGGQNREARKLDRNSTKAAGNLKGGWPWPSTAGRPHVETGHVASRGISLRSDNLTKLHPRMMSPFSRARWHTPLCQTPGLIMTIS